MNSFSKLLACFMLGLVVITYSCKKDDDDPVGCNYLTEVQNEANTLSAAATAFSEDPTNVAKCQAFKDAYQDYLNALESNIECATLSGQQAELQAAINQAQAELDAFQC
jgi:gluconate kinase